MINDFFILFFLLLFSAFFSSSEIAFIVANKLKVALRARKKNHAAKNAHYFVNNPNHFFSTILISNNIVNITFASLSSVFLLKLFSFDELEILITSSALLLIFGDLIPKYIGRELADRLVLLSATPLRLISILLFPLVRITTTISTVISRTHQKEDEEFLHIFDKEDIQNLIEESSEAGSVDEKQSVIINKVIDIREQRVYEAITPRTDIVGVELNSSMEEVFNTFIESGYSKLPVYEDNLDNIKGVIFTKDIFKQPDDWKSVLREVVFVPETKKSLEMLNQFLDEQFSIAVVVDEFGGTAGILTVEDLIEELFGEIRDEYDDVEEKAARKLDDNSFLLSGKVEVDYLNEEFNLNIPVGDYETIAGFVIYKIGRIPAKGEKIKLYNCSMLILKSDKTKIDLLKLIIEPETQE